MLKFQYAINLGLATLLVVPAVTLGSSQNDSLEKTLSRTIAALEQLAGIEERLQERDPAAIHDSQLWSETPLPVPPSNPGARDELLVALRGEVARLQRDIDQIEVGTPLDQPLQPVIPSELHEEEPEQPLGPATLGLDDVTRRRLTNRPKPMEPLPVVTSVAPTTPEKQDFETTGYLADAMKLGRAYYRQGRFDLALTAFETLANDVEAQYWQARSLEKLGRNSEAVASYGRVIGNEKAGALKARAQEDLDFLQWRLGFDKPHGGTKK